MNRNQDAFNKSLVKEMRLTAVVRRRCECGNPNTGWDKCPECGRDAVKTDLGLISYGHKSFWKRLAYKLGWIK